MDRDRDGPLWKARIYTGKTCRGEEEFKAKTEKHRVSPDNRDHCILFDGPQGVLKRSGSDYKVRILCGERRDSWYFDAQCT